MVTNRRMCIYIYITVCVYVYVYEYVYAYLLYMYTFVYTCIYVRCTYKCIYVFASLSIVVICLYLYKGHPFNTPNVPWDFYKLILTCLSRWGNTGRAHARSACYPQTCKTCRTLNIHSASKSEVQEFQSHVIRGLSNAPKTSRCMDFGTKDLKHWVLGPSWEFSPPQPPWSR